MSPRFLVAVAVVSAGALGIGGPVASAQTASTPAPVWTTSNLPWSIPGPISTSILGISCPATGSCFAAATSSTASGPNRAAIDTLSAGVWTQTILPTPAGAISSSLTAISCADLTDCVAVGRAPTAFGQALALVETLAAGSWTAATLPVPTGDGSADPLAVSCVTPSACIAAGYALDSSGNRQPLIEAHSAGGWTPATVPVPAGAVNTTLQGVSCHPPTTCVAAGTDVDAAHNAHAFAETLVPGPWTWSLTPLPLPTGATNPVVNGVSCGSATTCTAVGSYATSANPPAPLVEQFAGGTWTASTPPLPAGATSPVLGAVSCSSAAQCVATGQYSDASFNTHVLAEQLAGGTWTPQVLTVPSGVSAATLNGVSCRVDGNCVAAGNTPPWADALSSGVWTPSVLPAFPGPPAASLGALSCAPLGFCAAVGSYADASNAQHLMAETYTLGHWAPSVLPLPAGAMFPHLTGVSCPATGACVAVGFYTDAAQHYQMLVEALFLGQWYEATLPSPAGSPDALLSRISCPVLGSCVAIGSANSIPALTETYGSGRWTLSTIPMPQGLASPGLNDISCASATSCVAVGYDAGDLFSRPPLPAGTPFAERLSGGTWTPTLLPIPAGDSGDIMTAVSCVPSGSCGAIGGGVNGPFAEGLIGNTWFVGAVPSPAPSTHPGLSALSCPGSGGCVAIGGFTPTGGQLSLLAERRSGGQWLPSTIPTPAGDTNAVLTGLACSSISSCAAAGAATSAGGSVPLVTILAVPGSLAQP